MQDDEDDASKNFELKNVKDVENAETLPDHLRSLVPPDVKEIRTAELVMDGKSIKNNRVSPARSPLTPSPTLPLEETDSTEMRERGRKSVSPCSQRLEPIEEGRNT